MSVTQIDSTTEPTKYHNVMKQQSKYKTKTQYHNGTNQLKQIQYINKLHLDLKKQTKSTHNLQFRRESNKTLC